MQIHNVKYSVELNREWIMLKICLIITTLVLIAEARNVVESKHS